MTFKILAQKNKKLTHKEKHSVAEFFACILSRKLVDNSLGLVGSNSLVPMAACMLAQQMHAPNLTWISGASGYVNPMSPLVISSSSYRSRAEAVLPMTRILALQGKNIDFAFVGGLQFDQFGRINLVGIGDPKNHKYDLRGPGSAGTSFIAKAKQIFYYTYKHHKNVFVKKLDFISAVPSPPKAINKINRVENPHTIVTPLGVFTFSPPDTGITPISIHQGVTREELVINTGFEFKENILNKEIPITIPPSEEELEILRDTIDPKRLLIKYL